MKQQCSENLMFPGMDTICAWILPALCLCKITWVRIFIPYANHGFPYLVCKKKCSPNSLVNLNNIFNENSLVSYFSLISLEEGQQVRKVFSLHVFLEVNLIILRVSIIKRITMWMKSDTSKNYSFGGKKTLLFFIQFSWLFSWLF